MAHLIKALVLFTFGFAILANLGDALEKKSAPRATASTTDSVSPGSAQPPYAGQMEAGIQYAEKPLSASEPVIRTGTYAQVCSSFDPIAHPEQVIDILEYASETTGTPVDILFAVWQKETGFLHGDGRMSGGCDLKSELARRDAHAGTHHWDAMLAMADVLGWKQRYGENLENMTCSCPKHRVVGQYGGCCGPFQFSGDEIAHQYAIPLHLDPMRFCDGALIAGWELKKHYGNAFKPDRNWGKTGRGGFILAENPGYSREYAAWQAAMSRYYGGDTDGVYGRTAMSKVMTFMSWRSIDERDPGYLIGQILGLRNTQYSLRKLRSARLLASNP